MNVIKKKYLDFYDFAVDDSQENVFFFICDHASNFIPKKFKNLGLSQKQISSHIAWDIGARDLTLSLSRSTNSCCVIANFSRLLIDLNRDHKDSDIIIRQSSEGKILGNHNLRKNQLSERLHFHQNYHLNLSKLIRKKLNEKKKIKLIAIHSFTKKILNKTRACEIGILWNSRLEKVVSLIKFFQSLNINVGNNYPYSGFFYNYTLDIHSKENLLTSFCLELRNDLINNKKGIDKWTKILKLALKDM